MNIRMNSYIIRGIAMEGIRGHLPTTSTFMFKKTDGHQKVYLEQSWVPPPPHLLKSWLSPWLCNKYTHPRYLMVHRLASRCGFFFLSQTQPSQYVPPFLHTVFIVLEMAIHKLHNVTSRTSKTGRAGRAGPTERVYLTYAPLENCHILITWPLANERTLSYATPQCLGILYKGFNQLTPFMQ